jgi:hypothetical protein
MRPHQKINKDLWVGDVDMLAKDEWTRLAELETELGMRHLSMSPASTWVLGLLVQYTVQL